MLRHTLRAVAVAVVLSLPGTQAWAGVYEGKDAYKRGDYATALSVFRNLANQGNAAAQYHLGVMYANGQGVPQNYVQAHKWFNLSAARKGKGAAQKRHNIEALMAPAQIAEAQRLAYEWKENWPRYKRWLIGFFGINLLGAFVLRWCVWWLRRIGEVPHRPHWFTHIIAVFERFVISLLVVVASVNVAGTFVLVWMAMKMAANWNRAGRSGGFEFPKGTPQHVIFAALARGSLSALAGSLLSAGFGLLGGLIAAGQI